MQDTSRRRFLTCSLIGVPLFSRSLATGADTTGPATNTWHEGIAARARRVSGPGSTLSLLVPEGCEANIGVAVAEFERRSRVRIHVQSIHVDEINTELMLQANAGGDVHDVALPATYGLADLAEAGAILPLDQYVDRHEPAGFTRDYLYRKGSHHLGRFYGYQTDGDAYLMFYNRQLLEDPREQAEYESRFGVTLKPAADWQELDRQMQFFHRPGQGIHGGSLYRNPDYVLWEWWARFHAEGWLPLSDDMTPNINNAAGVKALEALKAASAFLTPSATTDGLTRNWEVFAGGRVYCNIGWGGTQKVIRRTPGMRNNVVVAPLPGGVLDGRPVRFDYFNWGWNYTVTRGARHPELAYLFALFAVTPAISTLAIRERDGFFDPIRAAHFRDPAIRQVYGRQFLDVQRTSLRKCIPDFYLGGQTRYLDALRRQIVAVVHGDKSAQNALDTCALQWQLITHKRGRDTQIAQWQQVKASYPDELRKRLAGT